MEKRNPADVLSDEYFDIQIAKAERSRIADIILIAVLALTLIVVAVCVWALPQSEFSETENRYLQTAEEIDFLSDLESGKLTGEIADMYSDQFPLRSVLVEIKAFFELAALKHENNGVILGKNGALIAKLEYTAEQEENTVANIDTIAYFAEIFSQKGVNVTFAVAPRSIDVLRDYLPAMYSNDRANSVEKILSGGGVVYIDLEEGISEHSDEYVWFLTDHHWTPLGAYYAYEALAEELGYTPIPLSEFEAVTVSEEFYGTTYSKAGIYSAKPDSITLYRFEGDESFKVTDAENGKIYLDGLYDNSKLGVKDKYSVFLGGDYGHIKISNGTEKEKLLVVKDSYFDSLAPFLARHFELDVIDLRYYSDSMAEYVRESATENILILCGADSLATSSVFTQLEYKLK